MCVVGDGVSRTRIVVLVVAPPRNSHDERPRPRRLLRSCTPQLPHLLISSPTPTPTSPLAQSRQYRAGQDPATRLLGSTPSIDSLFLTIRKEQTVDRPEKDRNLRSFSKYTEWKARRIFSSLSKRSIWQRRNGGEEESD